MGQVHVNCQRCGSDKILDLDLALYPHFENERKQKMSRIREFSIFVLVFAGCCMNVSWAQEQADKEVAVRPDAEKVLAKGLADARAENKKVLIHLGAPT